MTPPNLFNPDYLKHLCQKYGLRPSKKYGQNYLIDESVIDTIIQTADLKLDDVVVEVGPGFGTLTLALASRVEKVVAFEIEKKLEEYWSRFSFVENRGSSISATAEIGRNIEVIWGNILKELPKYQIPNTKYKVVANLPYQITSPVIRLFLEAEHPPTEMVLMVQKEVAERICAKPGNMSLLSVAVQYYADTEIVAIVPRSSFWPVPGVDSAVIKIKVHSSQFTVHSHDNDFFFKFVKAGFAQKRKLLVKNLESAVGKKNKAALIQIFGATGLLPTARAQELSVEQWIKLIHFLLEIRN